MLSSLRGEYTQHPRVIAMARTYYVGVRISQMDLKSFIAHQVVFVQPVLSSKDLSAVNGEVSW